MSRLGTRCWVWTACLVAEGYGQFALTSKHRVRAHRFSYELATGKKLATDVHVDHRCHNLACVNPAHLREATPKQNKENLRGASRNSKTGIRGVCWNKRSEKWEASVRHYGKRYHVGYFTDIVEAETAVIAKRNELYTHNDLDRGASVVA